MIEWHRFHDLREQCGQVSPLHFAAEAVPKRILDLMNVEGLTRENVASHLQVPSLLSAMCTGVSN